MSSMSEWAVDAAVATFWRRCARRYRCRAFPARREFAVHTTADWLSPFVPQVGECQWPLLACRDVDRFAWTNVSRNYGSARDASGRRCLVVRRPIDLGRVLP